MFKVNFYYLHKNQVIKTILFDEKPSAYRIQRLCVIEKVKRNEEVTYSIFKLKE